MSSAIILTALEHFTHRLNDERLQLITEGPAQNVALGPENSDQRLAVSAIKVGELIGKGRDKAIRGVHTVLVPVFVEEEGCREAVIILQFATQALCYCGLAYSGGSLQPHKTMITFGQMRSDELPNVDSRVFCTLFLWRRMILGLSRIQSLEGFLNIRMPPYQRRSRSEIEITLPSAIDFDCEHTPIMTEFACGMRSQDSVVPND